MAAAWLLTVLALAGVVAGVMWGQSRRFSSHVAAAGGGLLFGMAFWWLMPEIGATTGWPAAIGLVIGIGGGMALLDAWVGHQEMAVRPGLVGPLLIAVAIHSFLDGWSVRALAARPVGALVAPLGLGLHKVPEGMAVGWITRSAMRMRSAISMSAGVEALTLVGAAVEPVANRTGVTEFGTWWAAIVLAVISGSFLFIAFHALWPNWKRPGVVILFVATALLAGFVRR